jgi:hypothetical protein
MNEVLIVDDSLTVRMDLAGGSQDKSAACSPDRFESVST